MSFESQSQEIWQYKNDKSQSLQKNKWREYSKQENSLSFKEMFKQQLQQYEDIDQELFELVDQKQSSHNSTPDLATVNYMHQHTTLVPIGGNFQAIIPQILPEQYYKKKSQQMMKVIKRLKINDPKASSQFYDRYFQLIQQNYGPGRNYEDIVKIFNAYRNYGQVQFSRYLLITNQFWLKYFRAKDKALQSKLIKKKKKKNKGTIPI